MGIVEPIRNKTEITKIKEKLKLNSRNYLLFCIGINTGLRISDILNLDIKDVKNKNYISLKEQKTGTYKKFPINSSLKKIIDQYTKHKNVQSPLFTTRFNNRMDRITAYRIITSACKGIVKDTNIGTHTLRKTFGYHHYKQFKDIAMLQKIFNHYSCAVTLRYIGIEQEEIYKSYIRFVI